MIAWERAPGSAARREHAGELDLDSLAPSQARAPRGRLMGSTLEVLGRA